MFYFWEINLINVTVLKRSKVEIFDAVTQAMVSEKLVMRTCNGVRLWIGAHLIAGLHLRSRSTTTRGKG